MNFIDKDYIIKSREKYPATWRDFDNYCRTKHQMVIKNVEIKYLFSLYSYFAGGLQKDLSLYSFTNSYNCMVYNFSYKKKIHISSMNPLDTLVSFFGFYDKFFNQKTEKKETVTIPEKNKDDILSECFEIIETKFEKAYSVFTRFCYTQELNLYDTESIPMFFESFDMKVVKTILEVNSKKIGTETRYKWALIDTIDDSLLFYVIINTDKIPKSLIFHGFCNIDVSIKKFINRKKYAEHLQ